MNTNKYKGMTEYGVSVQDIKDFAEETGMEPADVWMKVIDKFVENGATEWEGYTVAEEVDLYREYWSKYGYVLVVDVEDSGNLGLTYHSDNTPETLIPVEELLDGCDNTVEELVTGTPCPLNPISLPITVHISPQEVVKFLSDNYTMTFSFKRLNETSDKWKGFDGFSGDGVHLVQIYFKEER